MRTSAKAFGSNPWVQEYDEEEKSANGFRVIAVRGKPKEKALSSPWVNPL